MLSTTEHFMASEIAHRQDRIARDWAASRDRRVRGHRWRPSLRLPRRTTLRLRETRLDGSTLA